MADQELVRAMTSAIDAALPVLTKEQKEAFGNGFRLSADGFNVRFTVGQPAGTVGIQRKGRADVQTGPDVSDEQEG